MPEHITLPQIAAAVGALLGGLILYLASKVRLERTDGGGRGDVQVYSQIELHREDRDRLDRLIVGLDRHADAVEKLSGCVEKVGRELEFQSRLRRERE